MAQHRTDPRLEDVEIHDVLSNERRQMVLEILREAETISARELSERIAEIETGESPPPRNIRQSAYVSLHQTHLPKLADLGIVEYDQTSKQVRLRERAKEVSVYMETVPKYGISWSEYYLGVSSLALLTVFGSSVGVPVLGAVAPVAWAYLFFALVAVSATYQTIEQGSSLVHRLREE